MHACSCYWCLAVERFTVITSQELIKRMEISQGSRNLGVLILLGVLLPLLGFGSDQTGRPSPILPSEERADREARQKAGAVISRFRHGNSNELWTNLRRSANPALRAFLIHALAKGGIPVQAVTSRLLKTTDPGERAALILALGEYGRQSFGGTLRNLITARLVVLYRNDPDPEVHSAIDWLLRFSTEGPTAQRMSWGQRTALERIDNELAGKSAGMSGWAVDSLGQTMVVVRAPATFQMGSDANEPRRSRDEIRHTVHIPRVFAISSKEVSVAQFQRYLEDSGLRSGWRDAVRQRFPLHPDSFWAEPEKPQFAVTWYDAARYCNWLSQKSGIPHEQWVYPDEIGPGMRLPSDYLHRTGYRLPTEAEWELAARAGTSEAHFFGDGVALLERYTWFKANSKSHGWPVGILKPNQLGLFDVYGNAWEWLQDRRMDYPSDPDKIMTDTEDTAWVVTNDVPRTRRGGSWSYDKETTRSAHRGSNTYFPDQRRDSVGFRVARTISSNSESSGIEAEHIQ